MTIPEATSHTTSDLPWSPTADPAAWAIVEDYASGIIDSFPEAKEKLIEYLGINYYFSNWQGAFRAINNAEEDTAAAINSIKALSAKALNPAPSNSRSTSVISHTPRPPLPQLDALEKALMEQVDKLQRRGCIQGTALTLDEMLIPIEEDCVGKTGFEFPGGDQDILDRVAWGADAEEVEESEDDEGEPVAEVTKPSEALEVCAHMERLCLQYASSDVCVIDLQTQVWEIWAHFHCLDNQSCVQTSLDRFWTKMPANKDVYMV